VLFTRCGFALWHWLRYRQDGNGAGNAIVPSTALRLITTIQQMATLQLSTKTTANFFFK